MQDLAFAEPQIAFLLRSIFTAASLDIRFIIVQHYSGNGSGIKIEFTGPDVSCLITRSAEMLNALEHLAAKVLRLEADQHDLLSFDACGYKRMRHETLRISADLAVVHVRATGTPFNFAPMSSYERRQLHLMLNAAGLTTLSTGEGAERRLILYPAPASHANEAAR